MIKPDLLIDYLDPVKATKAILRDWRTQEFRAEYGRDRIREIDAGMVRLGGLSDATPVQGGGNRQQEAICSAIDRKTVAERGYYRAVTYTQEIKPYWDQLTEDEQYMLTVRFVDQGEDNGIKQIMDRFQYEKTKAYKMSNAALEKLAKLIFW